MLKNPKAKTYLIPLVALIWGLVVLRYLGFFDSAKGSSTQRPPSVVSPLSEGTSVADTFSLLLNYRDPFLGTREKIVAAPVVSENSNPVVRVAPPVKVISTPQVAELSAYTYSGIVQDPSTGAHAGLIRFKGRSWYVTGGDKVGDADVIKVFSDSVWVKLEGKKQTLRR